MDRQQSPLRQHTWAIVVLAMVWPTAITWLYFIALADANSLWQQLAYSLGKVTQFALPVIWVVVVCRRCWPTPFRFERRGVLLGAAFGTFALGAMLAVYYLLLHDSPLFREAARAVQEKLLGLGVDTSTRYVALAVAYSLVHAFLEEYYWRWFVFGGLVERMGHWPAIVLSSAAFMAHHVLLLTFYFGWDSPLAYVASLAVAVGGVFWAWLYWRSHSLLGPWLSHVLIDAAIFTIGWSMLRPALA